MTYELTTTNGSPLGTLEVLENNGPGNVSAPREIADIIYSDSTFDPPVDAFVVAGDVTFLTLGMVFTVTGSGYDDTYTIDDGIGQSGDAAAIYVDGRTHIPVSSGIPLPAFTVVGVTTGAGGNFVLTNVHNGKYTFLPEQTFTIEDNSFFPANATYTVASAETSETYTVLSVNIGAKKINVAGDKRKFFLADEEVRLQGTNLSFGDGLYTVVSTNYVGGNTEIVVFESIPVGTSVNSQTRVAPVQKITIVTVAGSIPAGAQGDGIAQITSSNALTFDAPTTIASTAAPAVFNVVYNIPGDFTEMLIAGTPVQIKRASVDSVVQDYVAYVVSTTYVAPSGSYPDGLTQVATQFTNSTATTPVIITDEDSSMVFPIPPLPYGYLTYESLNYLTPLQLMGKGSVMFNSTQTWGHTLNQNLIHITENFYADNPPTAPLKGQLWFDTDLPALRVKTENTLTIIDVDPADDGSQTWYLDATESEIGEAGDILAVYGNSFYNTGTRFTIVSLSETSTPSTDSGFTTAVVVTEEIVAAAASSLSPSFYGYAYNISLMEGLLAPGLPATNHVSMGGHKLMDLATATLAGDAVSLGQADGRYVNISGDTMTGALVLPGAPTAALQAATKQYVDDHANGIIWITPVLDPNLFADNLSAPPAIPGGDTLIPYHRTYIVSGTGTGAWAGFNGHAMYYDGASASWKSVLGRAVAIGDRFGVYIEPDDDDTLAVPPSGGLTGHAGKIATITGVSPYTYTFYVPAEPDAVTVKGTVTGSSAHFGHSYTFRGTHGTGSYGTGYRWIEFSGPQMLVDGTGLRYTGNILNVGAGTGVSVTADAVELDTTYTDGRYVTKATSSTLGSAVNLTFTDGGEVLGLPAVPSASTAAASKAYVDSVAGGGGGGSAFGDAYFNSVSLLLHGDGTNGSTVFTDTSISALVPSLVGTPVISTAQQKFGTASISLNGSTDALSYTHSSVLNLASGDFTIEAWIYITSFPSANGACVVQKDQTFGSTFPSYSLRVTTTGAVTLEVGTGASSAYSQTFASGTGLVSTATWTHVAATRSGTTVKLFINGTEVASGTQTGTPTDGGKPTIIGRYPAGGGTADSWFAGYIDDLRITKGVARYTASFVAPTAAFPDSSLSDVAGPSSAGADNVVLFNGTTGKMIKDSGVPIASVRKQSIAIAISDETTAITAGTAKVTFRMPYAFTLIGIRASLTTAQTSGSILTVDVNEGGASILSTKLTIDNTEKTSTTAAAAPVLSDSALADDAEITIDVDQVGDGTATGLKVYLIGYAI